MEHTDSRSQKENGCREFVEADAFGVAGAGRTYGVTAEQPIKNPSTPTSVFNVVDFGALGDGETMNTRAFHDAVKTCVDSGGGVVYVPPGLYLSGPILLQSNVTLHLEAGAMVKGSFKLEEYPIEEWGAEWGNGSGESERAGLVSAFNADNVAVTGRGVLDGNALAFHDQERLHYGSDFDRKYTRQGEDYLHPRFGMQHGPLAHAERPGNLLRFFNCCNVLVTGVTIQNSPTWTVQFNRCERVTVTGVGINSFESDRRIPNDDGIDIYNCRFVHISDCNIQTGDDCIAMFGGEGLTVSNCTLVSNSAGLRVGFVGEDIRDCSYENLVIQSNRGISVFVRGGSSVENIQFSNILIRTNLITGHWWGNAEPIHISVAPWAPDTNTLGQIKNIRFSYITAESESGILVYGREESVIRGLTFENVRLRLKDGPLQSSYGGNFDLRASDNMATALFAHDIPGLYFAHVDHLKIDGIVIEWDEAMPDFFTHALQCNNVNHLDLRDFEGKQAHPEGKCAAIQLKDCHDISVRDSKASEGTGAFLAPQAVTDARLFANNDLRYAKKAIEGQDPGFMMSGNLMPT